MQWQRKGYHSRKTASYSSFLHTYKDSQAKSGWETHHFGLCRPDRTNIIFCGLNLLQPVAKAQLLYLNDITNFINFIHRKNKGWRKYSPSLNGPCKPIYINISQEEGITTMCNTYETFYKNSPPIPTHFIREMLQLHRILDRQNLSSTQSYPPGVRKGFVKGEALRLLRPNSSEETFEENSKQFKRKLRARGYPDNLSDNVSCLCPFASITPSWCLIAISCGSCRWVAKILANFFDFL